MVADDVYTSQSSYTLDIELPAKGILSTLWLIVKAKTLATDAGVPSPFMKYLISSLSVNEGGAAFLNAAPPTAFQADYYYKTGKFPHLGYRRWEAVGDVLEVIPILFGNHERDFEHTIDLSRLSDPKLSVTYDTATKAMGLYDLWDTSEYPNFTVIADFMEGVGVPASKGYHSLRQMETYTPVNDEVHLFELKGNRPIKTIYIHPDEPEPSFAMRQGIDRIRLHGDNEAWIPFDMTSERFKDYIKALYGTCKVSTQIQYIRSTWSQDAIVEEFDYRAYNEFNTLSQRLFAYGGSGRGFTPRWIDIGAGTPADAQVGPAFYHVEGIAPWSVYPFEMKKLINMDYLDPMEHSPAYLELTHADNVTTTMAGPQRIIIEDLVR